MVLTSSAAIGVEPFCRYERLDEIVGVAFVFHPGRYLGRCKTGQVPVARVVVQGEPSTQRSRMLSACYPQFVIMTL
jgi:hypothetical protein